MEEPGDRSDTLPVVTPDRARNRKFLVMALCILAALFLWFLRALENNYTTSIERQLLIDGIPATIRLEEPQSPSVKLRIEGPGYAILRYNLRIPRAPLHIDFVEIRSSVVRQPAEIIEAVPMGRFIGSFRNQLGDLSVLSVAPDTIRFRFKSAL
ncbi:MAG: hypothetical protein R6V75_06640 [Bacteroidales bacterium]